METNDPFGLAARAAINPGAGGEQAVYPLVFASPHRSDGAAIYLKDSAALALLTFFEKKGLAAIKEEERREQWYDDWLAYQAREGLYAAVLSPERYSTRGATFDLLRYARFLELFAFCSPGHGYSLQVTFLGYFSILMGTNDALKREATARLETGELMAFGVSEKSHGSDLLANEFKVSEIGDGQFIASGSKFYIGNANAASIISTLGRMEQTNSRAAGRIGRLPFVLVALRPEMAGESWKERKISTMGVRAAHVGAFDVAGYAFGEKDVIARGRDAWDAVFGTVTLGKFFLGFGSIGICEHALHEATVHLQQRILYGKPALEMPHLRSLMAQAYARLLAMKLYAYRALDYVHAASEDDRRYQLFCAVQKAKVSTEGVKMMALVSECIGAKGYEGDSYCEMASRDAAMIPGLEGSMHINLGLVAQMLPRVFQRRGKRKNKPLPEVPSLLAGEIASCENAYLMSARTGGLHAIQFDWFLKAFRGLAAVGNVRVFASQAATFRRFIQRLEAKRLDLSDTQMSMAIGQCLATIVYAQLIAENAASLKVPAELVSVVFSLLVADLSTSAMQLAAIPTFDEARRTMLGRMIRVPRTTIAEWEAIQECMSAFGKQK